MTHFYHVTERADAVAILREGFQGGWGDVGLGVYFYGTLSSAQKYASTGGWDGRLVDPVILLVEDNGVVPVVPHPDWPSAKYADMFWKDLDEDDEDAFWKPRRMEALPSEAPTLVKPSSRRTHR